MERQSSSPLKAELWLLLRLRKNDMFGGAIHDDNRCFGYETIATTEILRLRVIERIIHRHLGWYKSKAHRVAIPATVLLGCRQDFFPRTQVRSRGIGSEQRTSSPRVSCRLGLTDVHMWEKMVTLIGL